jgi:hypothetical protein
MNVGVYVAAGPNPIFLRLFMLQLARQTQLPQFLSIYENGNATPAMHWACGEIAEELTEKGVKILHKHSPKAETSVNRYRVPLQQLLYETETDIILKMDLDDFYANTYIQSTANMLDGNHFAINTSSNILLVRPFHGDFKYKPNVIMKYSPLGGAPAHVAFTRAFGNKYLGMLAGVGDKPSPADDEIMAEAVADSDVTSIKVEGPPDYTYVSHGNNHSSYAWQNSGGRIYLD